MIDALGRLEKQPAAALLRDNRLGIDATVYRKQTTDQIVNDIRGSYGTGFILFNLNVAETRNTGVELTLRGNPILRENFSWDLQAFVTLRRQVPVMEGLRSLEFPGDRYDRGWS